MKEERIEKTEDEWKGELSPEEYTVFRQKGTEAPFSGKLLHEKGDGMYRCAACGNPLFAAEAKFESHAPGLMGWPSFDEALPGAVKFVPDDSSGMHRTEVVCAKCGGHLGHIFPDDSETKTGKHYCINSVCLEHIKK
ncbi:MAG: peptide-methionine (R)-S-oxide reductase MsrB [Parcubacteria group bacterium]|nr:peptide-methionine (R)-S-oxide reductase MsrB [Parcubacteria group bacterium]